MVIGVVALFIGMVAVLAAGFVPPSWWRGKSYRQAMAEYEAKKWANAEEFYRERPV